MPQLDQKTARQVHNAEGSSFTLIDEDEYVLRLDKVVVSSKPDKNGNPYWIWTFSVVSGQTTGDKFKGKPVRANTGWAEDQQWFGKMFFEAFGVKPNANTDTLLGKEVKGLVGQREIQAGARKGQLTNDVQTLMSRDAEGDDDNWDADADAKDDKKAADASGDDDF